MEKNKAGVGRESQSEGPGTLAGGGWWSQFK